jgi:hypothetical protein
MRTRVDARLLDEAERFSLRHACEHCCHFDGERCGEAWPTAPHRLPLAKDEVVFCKEFELA